MHHHAESHVEIRGGSVNGDFEVATPTAGDRLLVTVEQAAEILGVGRTTMYELLAEGDIRAVQIRRCRRIAMSELRAYVARLCAVHD